jgi:hypothetical protein
MKNIFDLFGDKKSGDDAREAQAKLESQSRAAGIQNVSQQSAPVFEEYERKLQAQGLAARLIRVGPTGLKLKIQMKWTFGVVALEEDRFVVYVESDPAHSNGYARDEYTNDAGSPSAEAWTGTAELRGFLKRALAILLARYDKGTISSGTTGP